MSVFILGWLIGLVVGSAVTLIGIEYADRRAFRPLPPATTRQLKRAARANRLEVRGPERWVSPASADFDDEETR